MCDAVGDILLSPIRAIGKALSPDTPKPPAPPAAPPAAPPVMSDPGVTRARNRERQRLASAQGRRSTILTGPQGVPSTTGSPTTPAKTLLGS